MEKKKRQAAAGPDECPQADSSTHVVFYHIIPNIWSSLGNAQRRALRATCRDGRAMADSFLRSFSYIDSEADSKPAVAEELGGFVRGALSRGATPSKVALHFRLKKKGVAQYSQENRPEMAICGKKALAVFHALADAAQAPPPRALATRPALTHISLYGIPYLDVLARAISRAAPHLTSLTIRDDFGAYEDVRGATPGLSSLLTACSSSLTSLNLKGRLCGFPLPLANALRACTRLTHITGKVITIEGWPCEAATDLTRTVAAMSQLRSLNLSAESLPKAEHQAVAAALGSLAQINRLKLVGFRHCRGSDLLGRVLHPLRNTLTSLHLELETVNGAILQLLARNFTHLTHLTLESDQMHVVKKPVSFADGGGGSSCGGQPAPHQPLPLSLKELRLKGNEPTARDPRVLLALQLPPSLTQLTLTGLLACAYRPPKRLQQQLQVQQQQQLAVGAGRGGSGKKHAQQGRGKGARSKASAAAVAVAAVPVPCPGFDELLAAVQLMHGRYDNTQNLDLFYNWHPWPCSWPAAGDGHARLFGALQPLSLRVLTLIQCVLQRRDVEALVGSLPQLEDLIIQGDLHPRDVPLLSGLPKLKGFCLGLYLGRGTDAWCASKAVATALLPLARALPDLRHLGIYPLTRRDAAGLTRRQWGDRRAQRWQLREAVIAGERELKQALRGIGRNPDIVHTRMEEVSELAQIHQEDQEPDSDAGTEEYDNINVESDEDDGLGVDGGGDGELEPGEDGSSQDEDLYEDDSEEDEPGSDEYDSGNPYEHDVAVALALHGIETEYRLRRYGAIWF